MRAVVIHDGRLTVARRRQPRPRARELLVRVRTAGINNADLHQLNGAYAAPRGAPADIPGLEFAGEVVGSGRRLMALVGGGAQAEFAAVDERHTLPIPDGVSWESAGGFMEVFATAHDALFTQAQLTRGERVLVTGGAGGVGVAAIQLAREAGATIVAVVRREALHGRVAAFGAEVVQPGDIDGRFDVILETVGGANFSADVGLLANGGRLVAIGVGAGATAEVDFLQVMIRRVRIQGATLRARSADEKGAVVAKLRHDVLPLLTAGRIVVPVEATFPLADVEAAYARFMAGGKLGKVILDAG